MVVVELCQYRVSMLKMDERTLLREAQEISLEKLQQAVRQVRAAGGPAALLPPGDGRVTVPALPACGPEAPGHGPEVDLASWSVQRCPARPGAPSAAHPSPPPGAGGLSFARCQTEEDVGDLGPWGWRRSRCPLAHPRCVPRAWAPSTRWRPPHWQWAQGRVWAGADRNVQGRGRAASPWWSSGGPAPGRLATCPGGASECPRRVWAPSPGPGLWPLTRAICPQNGLMSGLMQMLLLKVSAHITEQLGMAPGGEFREAFKEVSLGSPGARGPPWGLRLPRQPRPLPQASRVPFCKFHLGDRPIPVTFKRAIAALSFWQKVKLAWGLCFLSDPIR